MSGALCIYEFEELEELLTSYLNALEDGDTETVKWVAQSFMKCGCYECQTNPLCQIDLDDIQEEMLKWGKK